MSDPVVILPPLDLDALRHSAPALREAIGIGANAQVISRPSLFAPGSEAIRLEAMVSRVLENNLVRLETSLGALALRVAEGARIELPGQRFVLVLSPSGTSARLDPLPLPAPSAPPAASVSAYAVESGSAGTRMPPVTSPPQNPQGSTPVSTPPLGVKGLAAMPGSTLGTQRPGDLWFQGNFSPQDSSLPAHPGQARVMQAFLEAGGLQKPDTAQRIASSFNDGIQPYRAMTEALALINPMASARIAALAPRSNSNFGIGLVFFLLCLRHGGVRRWLEDALEDDGEPDGGSPDLLEYFDRQIMPRRIAIQGNGSWDVVIVPFTAGELTQLVWAIRPDEQGSADPAGRQRFALQIALPHLGPMQVTGYVTDTHVEMLVLTLLPLPAGLDRRIAVSADGVFSHYGLDGSMRFSHDERLWLPFLSALGLDGEL